MTAKGKFLFSEPPAGGVPVAPADAATVIVVRPPARSGPFEALFLQRSRKQSFMGGATVFPGGALDGADCDPALAARVRAPRPLRAAERLGEFDLDPDKARGLFFAAVRETFEECGLLLGLDPARHTPAPPDPAARQRLLDGERSLAELAAEMDLAFDLSGLVPWSRWVTPESETRRFDTRFLVATLPAGQLPEPDARETTRLQWLTPQQALTRHARGEIRLMPPTLATVTELGRYSSAPQLFSAAKQRKPPLVRPRIFLSGNEFGIKLPNDPQYQDPDAPLEGRGNDPCRVVMRSGRWQLMSARDFVQGKDTDG